MTRPKGEVPFPNKVWLKRYHDQKKWRSISESQAIQDIKRYFCPDDQERRIRNAKVGRMVLRTNYFELMWLEESAYQDEL